MSDDCVPEFDICRPRGDSFLHSFQIKRNGVVVDITGDRIWVAVNTNKEPSGSTDPAPGQLLVLKTTPGTGVTLSDPTNGVFDFGPSKAQADAATYLPGTYYYDVE